MLSYKLGSIESKDLNVMAFYVSLIFSKSFFCYHSEVEYLVFIFMPHLSFVHYEVNRV